jgi:hypothetical protein
MATRKVWVIEEVEVDGKICHRQIDSSYELNEDGTWCWNHPVDRFSSEDAAEWDRVMSALKNVNGEDLRHLVCGVGLMTHCLNKGDIDCYS